MIVGIYERGKLGAGAADIAQALAPALSPSPRRQAPIGSNPAAPVVSRRAEQGVVVVTALPRVHVHPERTVFSGCSYITMHHTSLSCGSDVCRHLI